MTVLSAQEEMLALVPAWAVEICSQHPQLQYPPPVAKGMKEKSNKCEKLVGDSTETAEEDVEVAEDADGRVWGETRFECPGTDITLCHFGEKPAVFSCWVFI